MDEAEDIDDVRENMDNAEEQVTDGDEERMSDAEECVDDDVEIRMNDAEQDKKTRSLRKRKHNIIIEEKEDFESSDSYEVSSDYSSDNSLENEKGSKKCNKKKDGHDIAKSNTKLISKGSKDKAKSSRSELSRPTVKKKKNNNNKRRKEDESQEEQEIETNKARKVGPSSVIGHWYIASGFVKDLSNLFKAFDEKKSWRFSDFATCWQKYKFSQVYRGRQSFKELLEFTEEIFYLTKKFLSSLHTMKWRVAALYTMYGLYYKHPVRRIYKIRLDMKDYENLLYLVRSFQCSAGNPDPAYIFYKLMADSSFLYVATEDEMDINFYSTERPQEMTVYEMQWALQEHCTTSIVSDQERSNQKVLIEEYEKIKSQVWGSGEGPVKALSYLKSEMVSEVDSILKELSQESHELLPTSTGSSRDGVTSDESLKIGQRERQTKEETAALTEGFRPEEQLDTEEESNSEDNRVDLANSVRGDAEAEMLITRNSDSNQVRNLQHIMKFMQQPETLSFPNRKKKWKDQCIATEEETDESNSNSQDILLPNEFQQRSEDGKKTILK